MNKTLRNRTALLVASLALTAMTAVHAQNTADSAPTPTTMAADAAAILETQMKRPAAERVPLTVRHAAKCVAVFPRVVKAGFIVAAKHGNGLVSCRGNDGAWGAPAFFSLSEASVGLQAGVQSASIVLLMVDEAGVEQLLGEELSLGTDISVAAGPLGAAGQTNTGASVYSYVRAEGLFAGLQLGGTVVSYNRAETTKAYGKQMTSREVLFGDHAIPETVKRFQDVLLRYSAGKS